MKTKSILQKYLSLSLFAATCVFSTAPYADEWTGNSRLILGQKHLDDKDWDHDQHGLIGFSFDFKKKDWLTGIAIDFFGTGKEVKSEDYEGYTSEMHIGTRKYFSATPSLHPYIQIGISSSFVEENKKINGTKKKEDDNAWGVWAGAGFSYKVSNRFSIGLDARYSEVEATLFNQDKKIGGLMAGLSAGYTW